MYLCRDGVVAEVQGDVKFGQSKQTEREDRPGRLAPSITKAQLRLHLLPAHFTNNKAPKRIVL